MRVLPFLGLASVLAAPLLAGCSGPAAADSGAAGGARVESTPLTPAQSEREARYWARIEQERSRFVEADVRFMTDMIGHHAQALVMSAYAPTNGASPAVRTLAARIINAQRDEIATMQRWLRERDQPVPEVAADGSTTMPGMDHGAHGGHAGHGGMDHSSMPGMLSDAQLAELAAARNGNFDRLFLTYMIQHHSGAVVMVDTLFAADGAAQSDMVFRFASDVQVDQRTEVARMQQMLDALPPASAPQPAAPAPHSGHH
jgi:uncharacterized protein (DUF305 family)